MRFIAERNIIGFGLPTTYGSSPGRLRDQRRDRAGRGQRTVGARPGGIRVRRDEPRAAADQADRLGDRLERVVAGLADDDVVGVDVGHDEAGLVQGGRDAGLADHERAAAGHLRLEEVGRRERRGPDRLFGHVESGCAQPRARSRGVKIELFVSTRKGVPSSRHCWISSGAPGSALFSWTSTPSMSVSQHSISLRRDTHTPFDGPSLWRATLRRLRFGEVPMRYQ